MLSLYTVCFFGHRRIDDIITVENAVENAINKVLRQHEYVEFLDAHNNILLNHAQR